MSRIRALRWLGVSAIALLVLLGIVVAITDPGSRLLFVSVVIDGEPASGVREVERES